MYDALIILAALVVVSVPFAIVVGRFISLSDESRRPSYMWSHRKQAWVRVDRVEEPQ
jgi:hypothetical protein